MFACSIFRQPIDVLERDGCASLAAICFPLFCTGVALLLNLILKPPYAASYNATRICVKFQARGRLLSTEGTKKGKIEPLY